MTPNYHPRGCGGADGGLVSDLAGAALWSHTNLTVGLAAGDSDDTGLVGQRLAKVLAKFEAADWAEAATKLKVYWGCP